VTIRPVRTISRKGRAAHLGWMPSRLTWVTGWRGLLMGREALTSRSVDCVVVLCRIAFHCRSMVSQIGPEEPLLLQAVFGTGTVRGRGDGVWYFEVTTVSGLVGRVFPFFDRYRCEEPKRHDLEIFRQITSLIQIGQHLSSVGFAEILVLRGPMNRGGKRRRTDEELLVALSTRNPQRPYAELPRRD
jgi:hypothetical protein